METMGSRESFGRSRLENLLEKIEVEGEKETTPKIIFSDYGLEGLGELSRDLEGPNQEQLVAVIRCWNKNTDQLKDLSSRIKKMKEHLPGLAGVFLIINNEGEKGNATEESLELAGGEASFGVPIVPFRVENYTWTAGLNSGVALLNEISKEKGLDENKIRVVNMSFDTDLTEDELDKLNKEIEAQRFVFTERETGDGKPPISERGGKLWEKFVALLRKPEEANLAEISYAMRNTFNVIKLSDVVEMGGFNPVCNGVHGSDDRKSKKSILKSVDFPVPGEDPREYIKGMEDAEFFMRLILKALQEGGVRTLKDIRESFDDPVVYEDRSWTRFQETERVNKIINDMISAGLIFQGKVTDKYVLPESEQDFRISR